MKDILFFGIQWSGKWTQAQLLWEAYPDMFSYLSTGDLFRALSSSPNPLGDYVKDRIWRGELIDDRVTHALFESYFFTVIDSKKYMLLDGYPRSLEQMTLMIACLKRHTRDIMGVHFVLDDATAIQRMKHRARADDTDSAIHARIDQYKQKTVPMITYFAEHFPLVEIDASPGIEQIHQEVIHLFPHI